MKIQTCLRLAATLLLAVATIIFAGPAKADTLTLQERLNNLDVSLVSDTSTNKDLADQVIAAFSNTSDFQATVDSLNDAQLAAFKAYYLPSGEPQISVSPPTLTNSSTKTRLMLTTSKVCYSSSATTTDVNNFGYDIVTITVYGTWCTDGTVILSTPNVSSSYYLGGALGWHFVSQQADLASFTSSQAKFRAAVNMTYNFVYPALDVTVCAKLYGNTSGSASASTSCAF